MEMHSRDITLFFVLQRFNIMDYSSLFQYFLLMCYGPYSSVHLFVNFIIMTGELTHTVKEMVPRPPALSIK